MADPTRCPVCRNEGRNRTCHPAEDAVSRRNLPDDDPRSRQPAPEAGGLERKAAATELLDAAEALLTAEPKSYWLRGPAVHRLRDAYNAVVALAATPTPDPAAVAAPERFTGQMDWTCVCGHPKGDHYFGDAMGPDGSFGTWCQRRDGCHNFRPAIIRALTDPTSAEPGPAQSGPEPEQGPSPGSAHPDPVAAALAVARHFDAESFACDFGGRTAINLPNLEQVIPLNDPEAGR